MALKVAIVGMSPTAADAPWGDRHWEVWGLPWHDGYWRHMTRHFEMHDMRLLQSAHSKRGAEYLERLSDCERLYMQDAYVECPTAQRYPFEAVASTTGAYWNSSIAYALALAIHEGAEAIAIYGVDMAADDEYGYQRPNIEYLIGLARGKGIDVYIPPQSPLVKFAPKGVRFFDHVPVYTERYGWLG